MAVNLATKYSDKIASKYTHESYIKGRTSKAYDWDGVRGIKIYTPQTVALNDFQRSGTNRYGDPQEMQDTIQPMLMTQDKSFSLTIDKGNNQEQQMIKNAGKMLNLQIQEQCVPVFDKYALGQYIKLAGNVMGVSAKPTKSTIIETISAAVQKLDDASVPQSGRTLYVTAEMYGLIRLSPEFVGLEKLGTKAIAKGETGEVLGAAVVKVPTSYLPANCYIVLAHKNSVLFPVKIQDAKIHQDPPGISGALLEGRFLYDAFVLGAKCDGICAVVLGSSKQANVTFGGTAPNVTMTSSGAASIRYTTDGTDPRYSDTALIYGGQITLTATSTVRAVAFGPTGGFTSDVTSTSITV